MSTILLDAIRELPNPSARPRWRGVFTALEGSHRGEATRWLLPMRLFLVNAVGGALVVAAAAQGWIATIIAVDDTHICKLLAVLFLVGLAWSFRRAWMLSRELDALDNPRARAGTRVGACLAAVEGREGRSRDVLFASLRAKLSHRIAPVRHIAGMLVLIGLIGTIIGFIIALSGVDRGAVSDPSQIGPMVATLLRGMSMALFKTLVGSILNIWLMLNYRLLEAGLVHLVTRLVEIGERDAVR